MVSNQRVQIGALTLSNPVMNASGTFDPENCLLDPNRLGAVVTKSVTINEREGNPQPRIGETVGGMINWIGLENIGLAHFLAQKREFLGGLKTTVIISIAGHSIPDYTELARALNQFPEFKALEINVSCPNVEDGLVFGTDCILLTNLIRSVRKITPKTLITKLTPNVTDIAKIAETAIGAGSDAVALINTVSARAKTYEGKWVAGGLSGPAIKPIALEKVFCVRKALGDDIPLIAMGGIMNISDALEFFECGATAIAVGTANFRNPQVMIEIIEALENSRQ